MAIQLSSLKKGHLKKKSELAMHMLLGLDDDDIRLALQLAVFNIYGPVKMELMLAIASAMMGYTMRGFTGMFHARLSQGPGTAIWGTLRMTGLAAQ